MWIFLVCVCLVIDTRHASNDDVFKCIFRKGDFIDIYLLF